MDTMQLLLLARVYAKHARRSLTVVSVRAGMHTRFFDRLAKGKGCGVKGYRAALAWLSDNWPADLAWPADIPRPTPKKEDA